MFVTYAQSSNKGKNIRTTFASPSKNTNEKENQQLQSFFALHTNAIMLNLYNAKSKIAGEQNFQCCKVTCQHLGRDPRAIFWVWNLTKSFFFWLGKFLNCSFRFPEVLGVLGFWAIYKIFWSFGILGSFLGLTYLYPLNEEYKILKNKNSW